MYPNSKDYVIHMIHMAFRPEGHVLMPAYKKKYRVNKQSVAAEWVVSKGGPRAVLPGLTYG